MSELGDERISMESMGSATWPEGWDHDLGGVFNGRELPRYNGANGMSDIEHVAIGNRAGRRQRS
jgi:hypothetical protein